MFKLFILGFMLIVFSMCSVMTGGPREPVTKISDLSSKSPSVSNPDYEHDLEERCKDWIYWRNTAYKRVRGGDPNGAAEAGRNMNRFYNDMRKIFTEKEISDTIGRLEAGGYKVGM